MVEMARKKNATPLPEIPEKKYGVLLPHDAWCLSAVNYQIEPAPQDVRLLFILLLWRVFS